MGQVVQHDKALYRVTRWEELRPVPLKRGGSVGEWQVWGRKLTDEEIRQELTEATERMLEQ